MGPNCTHGGAAPSCGQAQIGRIASSQFQPINSQFPKPITSGPTRGNAFPAFLSHLPTTEQILKEERKTQRRSIHRCVPASVCIAEELVGPLQLFFSAQHKDQLAGHGPLTCMGPRRWPRSPYVRAGPGYDHESPVIFIVLICLTI